MSDHQVGVAANDDSFISLISLFTDAHLKRVEALIGRITPEQRGLGSRVSEFLLECREKFHSAQVKAAAEHAGTAAISGSSSLVSQLGSWVMVAFIGYFAVSCFEQFAQQHAAEEDEKLLKKQK